MYVFDVFCVRLLVRYNIFRNSNINGEDSCKKSYRGKSQGRRGEGSFRSVTLAEMNSFIGLIIYMGIVKVCTIAKFLSSFSLIIYVFIRFPSSMNTGPQPFHSTDCGPDGSCHAIVLSL